MAPFSRKTYISLGRNFFTHLPMFEIRASGMSEPDEITRNWKPIHRRVVLWVEKQDTCQPTVGCCGGVTDGSLSYLKL